MSALSMTSPGEREAALSRVRPLKTPPGEGPHLAGLHADQAEVLFQGSEYDGEDSLEGNLRIPRAFDHEIQVARAEKESEVAESLFAKAFREDSMSLEDFFPWRVQAAWRLTRALGMLRDQVAFDEMLTEATGSIAGRSPWTHPTAHTHRDVDNDFALSVIADNLTRAAKLPDTLKIQSWDDVSEQFIPLDGFALTPPPVPVKFLGDDGRVVEDYDPHQDRLLVLYVKTLTQLSDRLGISAGWEMDRDGGRYGLIGLLDPTLVRLAFPTPLQIVSWEMTLLDETIELLTRRGVVGTGDLLRSYYGLSPSEIASVVAMAKLVLSRRSEFDLEGERSLMLRRLEAIALQANSALDLDAELKALKQIALIQGLTKVEPENENDLFAKAIKTIASERESKILIEQGEV